MALNRYAKVAGQPQQGNVIIKQILKDKKEEILDLPSGNFPSIAFSDQAKELNIENKADLSLYYQMVQGGFDTSIPEKRVSEGIEIYREFKDKNGDEVDKVSLGDEVYVHLKIRSINKQTLYNIAVVDMLPAGLEAVPTSVRDNAAGTWNPDYTDIREDRLVVFGTLTPSVKEYIYTVRAINRGTFIVPPLYAESMYDRSIYAYSPQKPIIVE
jgi:uncharacterized repeat protein (TIGR01451 family)